MYPLVMFACIVYGWIVLALCGTAAATGTITVDVSVPATPPVAAAPAEEEARQLGFEDEHLRYGHGSHVSAAVMVHRAFWLVTRMRFVKLRARHAADGDGVYCACVCLCFCHIAGVDD